MTETRVLTFKAHDCIIPSMRDAASSPKLSAKNETGEYATFEEALKKILSVPRSKIKSKLNAEKRKKTRRSSVSRASNA